MFAAAFEKQFNSYSHFKTQVIEYLNNFSLVERKTLPALLSTWKYPHLLRPVFP